MKQFNFARHWKKKIVPLLKKPLVEHRLTHGMMMQDERFQYGDAPWLCGSINGVCPKRGTLAWYQPRCRCHYIAPFAWAIGVELYPELNWGFVTGDLHTVVVGYQEDWQKPEWVMDILNFDQWTAEESLEWCQKQNGRFYQNLWEYSWSFVNEPGPRPKLADQSHDIVEISSVIRLEYSVCDGLGMGV